METVTRMRFSHEIWPNSRSQGYYGNSYLDLGGAQIQHLYLMGLRDGLMLFMWSIMFNDTLLQHRKEFYKESSPKGSFPSL